MRRYWMLCGLVVIAASTGCYKPSTENGAALYRRNCAGCHSVQPGHVQAAPVLRGYFERSPQPGERQARRAILDGGQFMPPFRGRLSSHQVEDLIAYMKVYR